MHKQLSERLFLFIGDCLLVTVKFYCCGWWVAAHCFLLPPNTRQHCCWRRHWLRGKQKREDRKLTVLPRVPRAPFSPGSPGRPMSPREPISPTTPGGPLSPWTQAEDHKGGNQLGSLWDENQHSPLWQQGASTLMDLSLKRKQVQV